MVGLGPCVGKEGVVSIDLKIGGTRRLWRTPKQHVISAVS